MDDFPPPPPPDAQRAERLAALAARRSPRDGAGTRHRASTGGEAGGVASFDDRLVARLAGLTERRDASSAPPTAAPRTPGSSKRRHPAKGARVAALGLSLASTGGLAALFAMSGTTSGHEVQAARIVSASTIGAAAPNPAAASTDASTAESASPVQEQSAATLVIEGAVFHNKWGDVQVRATFAGDGGLVGVDAVQTPDRDGKSVRINDRAVPTLNSEALTAQSADVDTVSGATYTSTDYRRSLQSAIDAAVDAGVAVATA
jgi:uncharacterized protein with FMN-binding domain